MLEEVLCMHSDYQLQSKQDNMFGFSLLFRILMPELA